MSSKGSVKMALVISAVILALTGQSTCAYAGGGGHGGGRGGGGGHGWSGRGWGPGWAWGVGGFASGLLVGSAISSRPAVYETVVVGGVPYCYSGGCYYQQDCCGRYVMVAPPVVVAQPQVIVQQPQIVQQPVQIVQQVPQVAQQAASAEQVVNIPNRDGTYTAVRLVRKDSGYVGPQGEYYTGFPTVEQLKAMYGK